MACLRLIAMTIGFVAAGCSAVPASSVQYLESSAKVSQPTDASCAACMMQCSSALCLNLSTYWLAPPSSHAPIIDDVFKDDVLEEAQWNDTQYPYSRVPYLHDRDLSDRFFKAFIAARKIENEQPGTLIFMGRTRTSSQAASVAGWEAGRTNKRHQLTKSELDLIDEYERSGFPQSWPE